MSLVGRDYVLIANRYQGVKDRVSLQADRVRLDIGKDGKMGAANVRYSFKAMRYHSATISLWMRIPVPHDRKMKAAALRLE